jgi:hypothetical protein
MEKCLSWCAASFVTQLVGVVSTMQLYPQQLKEVSYALQECERPTAKRV